MNRCSWICLLSLVSLPLYAQTSKQPMMQVEAIQGTVRVARTDGSDNPTRAGSALAAGDAVSTGVQSRADLQLSRYGQIELGAEAAVHLLRLPFSGYDSDLSTDLRLQHGYLRVVWKRPGPQLWPLTIALGEQRASLAPGEYFFDTHAGEQLCIAGGEVMLTLDDGQQMLHGPACYRIDAGRMPQRSERTAAEFIAMRESRHILAAQPSAPATATAIAAEPPAAVAMTDAPVDAATESAASPPAEPAATVQEAPRAQSGWTLNVTSVTELATAQRDVARLMDAGYAPSIQTAQVNNRQWYRVQISGFATVAAAKAAGAQIEQRLGYTGTWTIKP